MSSLKLDHTNRVKNIRNKFEVLSETAAIHNVDKIHQAKNTTLQMRQLPKSKNDSHALDNNKNIHVMNPYNNSDKFGPSSNFGNRKRLKENQSDNATKKLNAHPTDYKSEGTSISQSIDVPNNDDEGTAVRKLSRQYSDPVKKLHRTPAFRCDKSEKLRETIKPVVLQDAQNNENHDRLKASREKLKRLGTKTEEIIKQDELTFSKSHSPKSIFNHNDINSNFFESQNKEIVNEVTNKELILKNYPELLDARDLIGDHAIPQHILDMYAKVTKPKTKNGNISKFDNLFSDSGVSSESENVLHDDLDEHEHSKNSEIKPEIQTSFIYPRDDRINNILEDSISNGLMNKNVIDSHAASADTLRKVLNQPLPVGPPPKKPPRTFVAIPDDESSDISVKNESKKTKSPKNKTQHRNSREESKLKLEKIENSLNRGKIMSPRLKAKELNHSLDESIGKFDTHPSPAHLRQSPSKKHSKEKSSKKKEEIHYMCTNILDPNFADKSNLLNSSDGSVTSSDEIRSSNSFTNCLSSLNCSSIKKNSTISYSKFNSLSNSANNSILENCCSCNLTICSKEKQCKNSMETLNTNVRLSTFSTPNTSTDKMDTETKCKVCGLNEKRENNFKCHLQCTCIDKSKCNNLESNTTFFVSDFGGSSTSINGPYGSLIRSKSQEHIYDEPINVAKRSPEKITTPIKSPESPIHKMTFTRSQTQLEDGFCRIRKSNNPYSDFKRKSSYTEETYNNDLSPFVRNDFRSKTVGRMKTSEKDNQYGPKVKDILRKLQGDINTEPITHDAIHKDSIELDYASNIKGKTGSSEHWQDSETSSTTHLVADKSPKYGRAMIHHHDESGTKNPSYDEGSRDKEESPPSWRKPPLHDKRNGIVSAATNPRTKRPQQLELDSNSNASSVAVIRKAPFRSHATDIDTQKLNNLMAEIYDTVTAVCVLNSPTMPEKSKSNDQENNVKEGEESESLRIVRSLTEKRKRYVRRVTSNVSLVPSKPLGSIKYANTSDVKDLTNDIYRNLSRHQNTSTKDFNKIKSVFENEHVETESVQNISPETVNDKNCNNNNINNDLGSNMKQDKSLFETCALIGINFSTGQAYIKYSYPDNAILPPQIEALVFPESDIYSANTSPPKNSSIYRKFRSDTSAEDLQLYSIVLTNEEGHRSYCYCRRVVPEGLPFCLPLAYCIITSYRAPSFYYKVLEEIESHHGSSDNIVKSILTQLHQEYFPKPGHSIFIKYSKSPKKEQRNLRNCSLYRSSVNLEDVLKSKNNRDENNISGSIGRKQSENLNDNIRRKSTDLSQKFPTILSGQRGQTMIRSLEKLYGESLNECKKSWKNENGTENSQQNIKTNDGDAFSNTSPPKTIQNNIDGIVLKRPIEPRFDEDNLSILFNSINVNVLVKIFGTLLLERKVILVGDKLSKLSACIEGLQSILYPFVWQHTLISTIPLEMRRDIFEAPVPMIAGIYICDKNTIDETNHANNALPNITTYPDSYTDLIEELKSANFDEGMVIDISCTKSCSKSSTSDQVLRMQGDESTLLPPSLSKTLRAALQHGPCISTSGAKLDDQARKSCNILVSEAFLRFFADLLVDYKECLNYVPSSPIDNENKNSAFDKELFIKKSSSKHIQYFLEWFTETAMFQNFIKHNTKSIADDIPYPDFYEVFDAKIRLIENNKCGPKVASGVTKNNYKTVMNKKMKVWRDKLRDFIH